MGEQRALLTSCVGTWTSERGPWVLALSKQVSIHNLCWLGDNAPEDATLNQTDFSNSYRFSYDGPRDKVKHFRNYKFCIAYENALEDGYATEKLYDALRAGCIPIYKGAPDIKSIWHYAAQSVIFVDDYRSMDALVDRIHQIAANQTLWESFFAWRRYPVPVPVMKHLFHGLGNVVCRACVRHRGKQQRYTRPVIQDWWRAEAVLAPGVTPDAWHTSGAYFSGA